VGTTVTGSVPVELFVMAYRRVIFSPVVIVAGTRDRESGRAVIKLGR
jgi:hypothetical protein